MIEEDKGTLMRERAALVESLTTLMANEDRVRVQGELSVVNAKIKALNTTEAARLKATADRRKVAGLAEAQSNAARARVKDHGSWTGDVPEEEDDSGQTATIDGWIDAVLLRHDVDFTRTRDGTLTIVGAPTWAAILGTLIDGIYAAGSGQALPPLPDSALTPKPPKSSRPKPKKR